MESLFPDIESPAFEALKDKLKMLKAAPPQVLLMEGGSEDQRLEMARWWACLCSCEHVTADGPCLSCDTCRQIAAQENRDVLAFDARIPRKKDEDEPGPIRALTVENARNLLGRLKDAPDGTGFRIVLLIGIDAARSSQDNAANALLKALEEPSPFNLFVILAPQRGQILPTLVSRSHCLTLPWPDPEAEPDDEARRDLAAAAVTFLQTGRGLFSKTALKSFDAAQASMLLDIMQMSLLRCLTQKQSGQHLDGLLGSLSPQILANLSIWLDDARAKIRANVSPGRVIEAMMSSLFLLLNQAHAR